MRHDLLAVSLLFWRKVYQIFWQRITRASHWRVINHGNKLPSEVQDSLSSGVFESQLEACLEESSWSAKSWGL